jgi:hypothetical protein
VNADCSSKRVETQDARVLAGQFVTKIFAQLHGRNGSGFSSKAKSSSSFG